MEIRKYAKKPKIKEDFSAENAQYAHLSGKTIFGAFQLIITGTCLQYLKIFYERGSKKHMYVRDLFYNFIG
jgi:hypothetical protein